jgi:hypothetical protein
MIKDAEQRTRVLEEAIAESLRVFNEQRVGLSMPEQEALAKQLFGTKLDDFEQLASDRRARLSAAIDAWLDAGGDRTEVWARARACCDSPTAYEVLIKELDRERKANELHHTD